VGWPLPNTGLVEERLHHFHEVLSDTLVHLGMNDRLSPEQMKAISQNIGHGHVLTTLTSYGEVSYQRQGEIIRGLATPQQAVQLGVSELAKAIAQELRTNI
jgi:hypothetical protein